MSGPRAKPPAPFACRRDFDRCAPDRLRCLLRRYEAWVAELDAPHNRRIWPEPVNAADYCTEVIAEIEAAIAARSTLAPEAA